MLKPKNEHGDLLRRLDAAGGAGADMSPGDPLAAEAAAALRKRVTLEPFFDDIFASDSPVGNGCYLDCTLTRAFGRYEIGTKVAAIQLFPASRKLVLYFEGRPPETFNVLSLVLSVNLSDRCKVRPATPLANQAFGEMLKDFDPPLENAIEMPPGFEIKSGPNDFAPFNPYQALPRHNRRVA